MAFYSVLGCCAFNLHPPNAQGFVVKQWIRDSWCWYSDQCVSPAFVNLWYDHFVRCRCWAQHDITDAHSVHDWQDYVLRFESNGINIDKHIIGSLSERFFFNPFSLTKSLSFAIATGSPCCDLMKAQTNCPLSDKATSIYAAFGKSFDIWTCLVLVSEWVIKFNGLSGDSGQRGPYSPYKPCNHSLYIGIIILPHINNPQSTGHNLFWEKIY